jgi:hypothetical protein
MPMHWFSTSGSPKDVRLFVLDGKVDEGEWSKAFFSGKVACMKQEEVE